MKRASFETDPDSAKEEVKPYAVFRRQGQGQGHDWRLEKEDEVERNSMDEYWKDVEEAKNRGKKTVKIEIKVKVIRKKD